MPGKCTLPKIHALTKLDWGKSPDYRNFTQRLIATGIIIKLKELKRLVRTGLPFLNKFDKQKYYPGLKEGLFNLANKGFKFTGYKIN